MTLLLYFLLFVELVVLTKANSTTELKLRLENLQCQQLELNSYSNLKDPISDSADMLIFYNFFDKAKQFVDFHEAAVKLYNLTKPNHVSVSHEGSKINKKVKTILNKNLNDFPHKIYKKHLTRVNNMKKTMRIQFFQLQAFLDWSKIAELEDNLANQILQYYSIISEVLKATKPTWVDSNSVRMSRELKEDKEGLDFEVTGIVLKRAYFLNTALDQETFSKFFSLETIENKNTSASNNQKLHTLIARLRIFIQQQKFLNVDKEKSEKNQILMEGNEDKKLKLMSAIFGNHIQATTTFPQKLADFLFTNRSYIDGIQNSNGFILAIDTEVEDLYKENNKVLEHLSTKLFEQISSYLTKEQELKRFLFIYGFATKYLKNIEDVLKKSINQLLGETEHKVKILEENQLPGGSGKAAMKMKELTDSYKEATEKFVTKIEKAVGLLLKYEKNPIKLKEDIQECHICYETKLFDDFLKLPCSHVYHTECVQPHLATRATCPYCGRAVSRSTNEN